MAILALVFLALVFLVLALHPFTTYPLSLMAVRAIRDPAGTRATPHAEPTFAICMSAYNEEAVILDKVANLLELKSTVAHCDICIYVDAASDRTAALLAPFADRLTVIVGDQRVGKSHGLNRLVAQTSAQILVFTDANVTIDRAALKHIATAFADRSVGCVCGSLVYVNTAESATATTGGLYWRIEEFIKQLESDTWGVIGAHGALFAVRRELHVATPDDLIDDFYLSMRILIGGHRVVRAPLAIAYERTSTDDGEEFRRKVRISCQAFNVHRLIWREVRPLGAILYCYLSHRLLKWFIIYNLGISGILASTAVVLCWSRPVATAFVICAAVLLAAGCLLDIGVARRARSIAIALAGTGWGLWRSVRGDRFQTWNPISTVR